MAVVFVYYMETHPDRKTRITLGAVVVENPDISLGQCRLSSLMAVVVQDATSLLRYYFYRRLHIMEKVDEMVGRVVYSEDGVNQRRIAGRDYLDMCRDYAHSVAKEMKKWGVHEYELESIGPRMHSDGTFSHSTFGWFDLGDEIPDDALGRPIEDLPDDGIALFRATLNERLSTGMSRQNNPLFIIR